MTAIYSNAYALRPIWARETMKFGEAIVALELLPHERVRRAGWNGKGMFVFKVERASAAHQKPERDPPPEGRIYIPQRPRLIFIEPHLVMRTADGKFIPWLASQTDILAADWSLVPIEEAW